MKVDGIVEFDLPRKIIQDIVYKYLLKAFDLEGADLYKGIIVRYHHIDRIFGIETVREESPATELELAVFLVTEQLIKQMQEEK